MNSAMKTSGLILSIATLTMLVTGFVQAQSRPEPGSGVPRMLVRPDLEKFREPSLEPGSTLVAHELEWQQREPEAVARRLMSAMEVVMGEAGAAAKAVRKQAAYDTLRVIVNAQDSGGWGRIEGTPMLAKYDARFDEIRLIHEERDVVEEFDKDIEDEGARKLAEDYLRHFAERGLIDARLYKEAAMQLGYRMVGAGPIGGEIGQGRIVGYRVTYRPRLDGFQMANAGVRFDILPTGELASVRFGGVVPVNKELRSAKSVEVRVSTSDIMKRFHRGMPKGAEAAVAWSQVMYVMPEDAARALVEPMMLISWSQVRQAGDQSVVSRRKTLAYSLTAPKAEPIDFDKPYSGREQQRTGGESERRPDYPAQE